MATRNPKGSDAPPFVAGVVAGPRAAPVAEALAAAGEAPYEVLPLEQLAARVALPPAIGAVVLAPAAGDAAWVPAIGACHAVDPSLPVLLAGEGLGEAAVAAAFRAGAADFIALPASAADRERLAQFVARRYSRLSGTLFDDRPGMPRFIGRAAGMQAVARLIERVAPSEATVLILGESGTGKELVARACHVLSPRARGPFVAINCAAIPETLLENELFGHEKGSYTGASSTAIGKVEAAEKGTLFLDEIGEMPLALQAKILRLLQDRSYDRIGGTKPRKADVRIVTATNRELREEVAGKRFREDLYYRLSVIPVTLPPLRERSEDIPLLALAVLERLAKDLERPGLSVTPEAMDRLIAHPWPGNVRELQNALERAAVLAVGEEIGPDNLELGPRPVGA